MDNYDPYFDITIYYTPEYTVTDPSPHIINLQDKRLKTIHMRMIDGRKELGKTIEIITWLFRALDIYIYQIIID